MRVAFNVRTAVMGVAAAAFATASLLVSTAGAQDVTRWRVQSHWPSASSSFEDSLVFLKERLEKRTEGRLMLQLHEAGALFPAQEIFNAVSRGVIQMGTTSPAYLRDKLSTAGFAAGLPFAFREVWEAMYFHKVLGFEDVIRAEAAEFGVYYTTDKVYPTEMVLKKPIETFEDFQGLKIRSSGALQVFLTEAGAAASYVPGPELYPALATGVMDGAHWGAAQGAQSMGLHEVAKYHVKPPLTISGVDVLVVNQEAMDALPEDVRDILVETLEEQFWLRSTEYQYLERVALAKAVAEHDVKVHQLPDEVMAKLTEVALQVWEEEGKRSDKAGEILQKLKDFLTELGHL